jgi:arginase family enzyme
VEIIHYLEPANTSWNSIPGISTEESLGGMVSFYQGNENWFRECKFGLVVIGVPEDRNGFDNRFCAESPNTIRKFLYGLRGMGGEAIIGDAGNVRGNSINDRYQALKEITAWFLEKDITLIVLGGTQDITIPLYNAYSKIYGKSNLVIGDAMVDLDINNQDFSSRTWINKVVEEGLVNDLTILGAQNYLISSAQEVYLQARYFDLLRLGEMRGGGIKKTEMPLRDSNLVSIDFRMIAGQCQVNDDVHSPHGIEHHEACQISRYAGLSDRLRIFGLFEVSASGPSAISNAALASQMVWHFMDGFLSRYKDFPIRSLDEYKYYVVHLEEFGEGLKFYQNPVNGRWWMEVPSYQENIVVSCDYDDYRKALRNEIPEKWWRFFLKCKGDKIETKN